MSQNMVIFPSEHCDAADGIDWDRTLVDDITVVEPATLKQGPKATRIKPIGKFFNVCTRKFIRDCFTKSLRLFENLRNEIFVR